MSQATSRDTPGFALDVGVETVVATREVDYGRRARDGHTLSLSEVLRKGSCRQIHAALAEEPHTVTSVYVGPPGRSVEEGHFQPVLGEVGHVVPLAGPPRPFATAMLTSVREESG
jgi:hypothetical protein